MRGDGGRASSFGRDVLCLGDVLPADDDSTFEVRERQNRCFRLDGTTGSAGESAPGLDGDRSLGAPPGPDDVTVDEDGAWPDSRCPQFEAVYGVGNEEPTIVTVEEEVGVAAGKEPCRCWR